METVASALRTLIWPILIALGISAALWAVSVLGPRFSMWNRRKETPHRGGARGPSFRLKALSQRLEAARARVSGLPQGFVNGPLVLVAVVIAAITATVFLYVPMVSTTYRALYRANCHADAVAALMANRSGSGTFAAVETFDACRETKGPGATARTLSPDEVFYLLERLGLRDPREKTTEDLFRKEGTRTRNHLLATTLVEPGTYIAGTPTSALISRLATHLGSGKDIHAAGVPGADDTTCRTAGIAAVMAQQPYAHGESDKVIGAKLLASTGTLRMADLLGIKDRCAGDKELADNKLGRAFEASHQGWLPWPLLTRPTERVSEGGTITIALSWANWKPADSSEERSTQQAVIDFMRNIASEASSVPEVREGRIAVNFFIGWERLAILIVSTFLVICLLWQQAMRIIDERHLRHIRRVIQRANPATLPEMLQNVRKSLNRTIGRSAPREILDAAIEMVEQRARTNVIDRERLRRAAEHEMRIQDRSRFFFLAGLPLLPTIGFIGTVRSLIEALAVADNIPRARDAVAQVAAVSDVTSTLSLCFSTTLMALAALLVFVPLDLWQSMRERQVVEETERLLDDALLPRL